MPGLRWFIRRRVEHVIGDMNARLNVELPPFMLARRNALIDRLVYDPEVMEAIGEEAARSGAPREEIARKAEGYVREMVPGFNAYFYFRIGYWMARKFLRFFYRVRIGHNDETNLTELGPKSTVVLVMNHRSNFDYLLVTYLASRHSAISYAAGEWTLFWPMGPLLRAMGAYFVRRGDDDPLYRRLLLRYVELAIEGQVPQGIYPEGALSRDGALQPPKLGLLDYMTRNFDPSGDRDIVFVPVGINYERVVEDEDLLNHRDENMISKRGTLFVLRSALGFFLRSTPQLAFQRRVRFGRACANFGPPVSFGRWVDARGVDLRTMDRKDRFREIAVLADHLMDHIARLIPVLPLSIVATAFWQAGDDSLTEEELKTRAHKLVTAFDTTAAHVYLPFGQEELALEDGLRRLVIRKMVIETEPGRYVANRKKRDLLAFYVRPVLHFLPAGPAGAE